jgi:hypothetical protein
MSAFLNNCASANPNAFSTTASGGLNLPTGIGQPASGVRGVYSVNGQGGAVPQHVDMRTLTPTDLDADARVYGSVMVRIGKIDIVAAYRPNVGDVVYTQNGVNFAAANVQAVLSNAFALAQH